MALLDWLRTRTPELRLALRVTIAGAAAFLLARLLTLPQGYWAVITAVIVIQASVGGSLKAALDRLMGTLAGAGAGALVAITVPHDSTGALCAAIAAALLPLAFLAAVRPSFRIAPVTAVIMLLPGSTAQIEPWIAAVDRVAEIGLGNLIGIAVALFVLPARAHAMVAERAARIVTLNADLLDTLLNPAVAGMGRPDAAPIHARVRAELKALEAASDEAARERRSHLTDQPDPEPLVRALYRLRHDLVIIGRAASNPLPDDLASRMAPVLAGFRDAAAARLREVGAALAQRRAPVPSAALEEASKAYAAEIEALRAEGSLRGQPAAIVGRFWSLLFAFDQLQQDLAAVGTLARNWAGLRRAGGDAPPDPAG